MELVEANDEEDGDETLPVVIILAFDEVELDDEVEPLDGDGGGSI